MKIIDNHDEVCNLSPLILSNILGGENFYLVAIVVWFFTAFPYTIPVGEYTSIFCIGLLFLFLWFHTIWWIVYVQINWFDNLDNNVNFFYPILSFYIGLVGSFISVTFDHEDFSKTKLDCLLPLRGVWILFAYDRFFLPMKEWWKR